jgi:hypothetical protein
MKKRKEFKKKLSNQLGMLGIILIIFAQLTNFLKIEPFVYWYITILWYGYILVVDSVVYTIKKNSYIMNRTKKFFVLIALSVIIWLIFEFYNIFLKGWYYVGTPTRPGRCIPCYFAISTIIPAVFETGELIKALRLFQKTKIKKPKIDNKLLYPAILFGLILVVVPFLYPSPYMWFLVWSGFIIFLDPINYLFHEKSLIGHFKSGKLTIIISLFVAGYICGFFWELWNYWAYTKWHYTVPILDGIKIFEIPVIGFFAYGFFAWELYVMYYFAKLLIPKQLEIEMGLR